MNPNGNGNGTSHVSDWLSPKAVMTVGVPTAGLVFLLLVITGLIPTPLTKSWNIIEEVAAEHEGQASILDEIRYLQRVECIRTSETPEQRTECYMPKNR